MRQWTIRGEGGPESCHASVDVKRGRRTQRVAMRRWTLRGGRRAQRVAMRQWTLRGGGGPRELPCAGGR